MRKRIRLESKSVPKGKLRPGRLGADPFRGVKRKEGVREMTRRTKNHRRTSVGTSPTRWLVRSKRKGKTKRAEIQVVTERSSGEKKDIYSRGRLGAQRGFSSKNHMFLLDENSRES